MSNNAGEERSSDRGDGQLIHEERSAGMRVVDQPFVPTAQTAKKRKAMAAVVTVSKPK